MQNHLNALHITIVGVSQQRAKRFIVHILEDAVSTEEEDVPRLYVRDMMYVSFRSSLLIREHSSRENMLLCGAPCLSVGYLSVVYEFVDHGVILRAEEHLSRFGRTCRTEMIYPTVANMRHGSTVCVEFEHRHSGAHLHHFIGVILLSKGKQRLIHRLIDHLIRENALYRR